MAAPCRCVQLYPGDAYVNWIGLSGYYGTAGTTHYLSPGDVFNATLRDLHTFTSRPIVVTETGSTDVSGLKAQWITAFAAYLPQHPEIIGFLWYEAVRETDWRITSSAPASRAFAALAAGSRYAVDWTPDAVPLAALPAPAPAPSTSSSSANPPAAHRTSTPKPTKSH